ncbi:diguanylate cyclase [Aliiglaciecola sp. 3_MG-2023]|uniref:GGDEF domain-containing response regulator n=1 Tax=Aliiglaciecola sp. 3_MG-2023 TaxID=3062644 RepID=UPI0026E14880|nr:diguanylate cyclase [Aliiglaciecola sp. 3_MG-2023]MDO6693974.1 diguanylate cyclase [Aliiglaciecola sp. 3_MG-2023]
MVEDEPISALIAAKALSDNFITHHVSSGQEALDFCDQKLPDIILMDINMPVMDGLTACRKLKDNDNTQEIPIIFVSSHNSPEAEDECWEAGCTDFITKPFSVTTLRHRVNSHLAAKLMSDKLKRLATVDGLTDVQNRHYFDGFLADQMKLCTRLKHHIGLILIDIDNFKLYNDTYGHIKGDECLRQVASTLRTVLKRPTDCLARYGGEEFAVVLPHTDARGVEHIANSMLSAIRALNLPHKLSSLSRVTISAGGICVSPQNLSQIALIQKADQNLYSAKDAGRDQFVVA